MIKYETSVYVTVADILIGLYHILLAPSFHLDITYSSLCTASISLHCASLSGNLKAAQVKPGIVGAVNTPGASLKQWRDWNRWINSPTSHPLEGQFWNTFCLFPWWVPCGSGSSTYCRNQLSNTLYWLSFLLWISLFISLLCFLGSPPLPNCPKIYTFGRTQTKTKKNLNL